MLLFGVGGVGGHCLDALYRTGVVDVTIVDFDVYDISNQNRQIGSEAVGEVKVHRLSSYIPALRPYTPRLTRSFWTLLILSLMILCLTR